MIAQSIQPEDPDLQRQHQIASGHILLGVLELFARASFTLADETEDLAEAAIYTRLACDLSDLSHITATRLQELSR